jgi:predicted dinucleotide-utilizing enzyme
VRLAKYIAGVLTPKCPEGFRRCYVQQAPYVPDARRNDLNHCESLFRVADDEVLIRQHVLMDDVGTRAAHQQLLVQSLTQGTSCIVVSPKAVQDGVPSNPNRKKSRL